MPDMAPVVCACLYAEAPIIVLAVGSYHYITLTLYHSVPNYCGLCPPKALMKWSAVIGLQKLRDVDWSQGRRNILNLVDALYEFNAKNVLVL